MALDTDKIDDAVLALLYLTLHDHWRAWKGFDWDALDRLYEKGLIDDPVNKAKSVVFTEEGLRRAEELFQAMFTKPDRSGSKGRKRSGIRPGAAGWAAATQALDPVLLVSRDLPYQGQPAIKGQVRDRHEEHRIGVLRPKIEFAQDPTFVARIVDLGDLAPGRQVKTWRLLLQLGQHGWRRHGR